MYHSRKIGVFISHIMGHYQKNVCQGIIDTAVEYGYTAEIFATIDGEDLGAYGIGEASILHLPDYDDYCGIIFASDTYPSASLKEQIRASLTADCTCPIVEIAAAASSFPTVFLSNDSPTAELVSHLATVHGCRRICYLGCSSQSYFSDNREQYYRNAMADAKLTVGTKDVCSCPIDAASIHEALHGFLQEGSVPDAIVCYNDEMALLLMHAAQEEGYRIPKDIAVTGCDHTPDGQNLIPALTTVTFPVYALGATAIDTLLALIHGTSVPAVTAVTASPVYAGSCGCEEGSLPDILSFHQAQSDKICSLEASILTSMRMSTAASGILDLDDGMDLLEHYIPSIEHCKEFYLCLYDGWDSPSHRDHALATPKEQTAPSDEIFLALAIRDGKRFPSCSFRRTASHTLLPEQVYRSSSSAYIYTPLFFEEKEFGYVALAYEDNRIDYHFQLVHWFLNINQMLHNISESKYNALLVRRLKETDTTDPLTGLYNRQGYLQHIDSLIARAAAEGSTVACVLFRLDNAAMIQDTYGRAERDFALRIIGQALTHIVRGTDLCARFDGDEFCLLACGCTPKDADDLIARVHKYLSNYNHLSAKEYEVSVCTSCAVSRTAPEPQEVWQLILDTANTLPHSPVHRLIRSRPPAR